MPVDTTAAGVAVLEVERFEWAAPDRIEIVGYWSGLRGRRFMRPTLVLKGEGDPKRLLALLDHKPWTAEDGQPWIAAFAWKGEPVRCESADLNVASGLDVELPPPRMRPGKPRRFRHRAVARDASREAAAPAPLAGGIVSDPPAKRPAPPAERPGPPAEPSDRPTDQPDSEPTVAIDAAPKEPSRPAPERPDPEPTLAMDAAPKESSKPAPAAPDPDATQPVDTADTDALRADLDAALADVERLRGERDQMRRERDAANEKARALRGELETERQRQEKSVADARAGEREKAGTMLAEGAELRAAVERQREIAYLERDDAKRERERAIEQRDKACVERDRALHARKQADRERKEAFAQRDRAIKFQQRAEADSGRAAAEREDAVAERDEAVKARDDVLSVHERGLPLKQPKPRFLPEDEVPRSDMDIWAPRAVAIGILLIFAFIVLRLLTGA